MTALSKNTDTDSRSLRYTPALILTVFMLLVGGFIVQASANMAKIEDDRKGSQESSEINKEPKSPVDYVKDQAVYCALGVFAAMIAYFVPHSWYKSRTSFFCLAAGVLILLGLVYIFPDSSNQKQNVHRWVVLPIINKSFQPSEFAKLSIVMLVAIWSCLNPKSIQKTFDLKGGLIIPGSIISFILLMIFLEPDYATTLICASIAIAALYVGGAPMVRISLSMALVVGILGYTVLNHTERGARIKAWQNLFEVPQDKEDGIVDDNLQQLNSIKAIAAGHIVGKGLGMGASKLGRLSEHDSDFIYAGLAEEFGFVGSLALLIGFVFILYAGASIAVRTQDHFGRVMAMGIVTMISLQVVLHISTTSALVPNTGLTLPFFSSGGSNLVVMMVAMGLLMSVERESRSGFSIKPASESAASSLHNPFE